MLVDAPNTEKCVFYLLCYMPCFFVVSVCMQVLMGWGGGDSACSGQTVKLWQSELVGLFRSTGRLLLALVAMSDSTHLVGYTKQLLHN